MEVVQVEVDCHDVDGGPHKRAQVLTEAAAITSRIRYCCCSSTAWSSADVRHVCQRVATRRQPARLVGAEIITAYPDLKNTYFN